MDSRASWIPALRKHSVDETGKSQKQVRVKLLTPEQRQAIEDIKSPAEIPIEERRRQYAAIGRVMKSNKNLPEGLVAKWNATGRDSLAKFGFLGCFVLDESFQNMKVEAHYVESGPQRI